MHNKAFTPTGPRLVLVEDDEDVRKSLTLVLRGRGFSLDVFDSGLHLLASGHMPCADCFLIDYKMPKIDGIALLEKLREYGLRKPALLITGFFSNDLCATARSAGFSDIMEKPTNADKLVKTINKLIAPTLI